MRRIIVFLVMLGMSESPAPATWSVIAVDQASGEVVIASATCVAQAGFAGFPAAGLMDVQAIVVPGKGAAAAQAMVDRTRANQQLIFNEMVGGTPPAEILKMLQSDPQIELRQFAIVDLEGRQAAYSGPRNLDVSLDVSLEIEGRPAGQGIFASIQGNILASEAVVHEAAQAFRTAGGFLTDRVMAAMVAADANGGDRRCNCRRPPHPDAPCDTKTSHVAYLLKADRENTNGESYNDGDYTLYLNVTNENILPTEDANPVKTLALRYAAWKSQSP